MTRVFFIFLLITGYILRAQTKVISGKVYSSTHPVLPVKNAKVKVVIPNTDFIYESISDSTGFYSFSIPRTYSVVILDILTDVLTSNGRKKDGDLRYFDDEITLDISNGEKFRQDFYLKPVNVDKPLPSLLFNFNSTKIYWDTTAFYWKDKNLKDAFKVFRDMLIDNPEIIIEVAGYCDILEKNPKKLSQKRADKIKRKIRTKNIPSDRIVAIGKGAIDSKYIDQPEEYSRQKSRHVYIKVLSFDYKVKSKDKS